LVEAENRVNAAIEENRRRIDSERTRTIELLGIFTAIFAFIFSGVQVFARLPLTEALVLQVGLALIMILFFIGLHMVIEPEARTKRLIFVVVVLVLLLSSLPLYVGAIQRVLELISR
jgi:vacuolar-type H+-ATPase subunit I/STV1